MIISIKTRIISFYLAVLFVALFALGLLLHVNLDKIVYNAIDSSVLSRAKALATIIYDEHDETEFDFSDASMWEYNSPNARIFFQILNRNGKIIEKSKSLGNDEIPFLSKERETIFKTVHLKGGPVRVVNFFLRPFVDKEHGTVDNVQNKNQVLIVQCASDISTQISILGKYKITLWSSIITVMVISAFGGFLIAGRALVPVKKMSEIVGQISEENLALRIDIDNTPKELKILSASFNSTLDRLTESFRLQKQFTADASHELRTPLAIILSQSEITLRRERSTTEYKNALVAVMDAAKIMSSMVGNLLFLARLTSQQEVFEKEPVILNEIIAKTVRLLKPVADLKRTCVNVQLTENFLVSGEKTSLLQLYVNVIDNAIKYGPTQGRIDISIWRHEEFIVSEIKDHGIGIPQEDLDKIFDRFYRVDKSRSRDGGSTGLGMSICKAIVQKHSGRIVIKSSIGKGTTVLIYFEEVK